MSGTDVGMFDEEGKNTFSLEGVRNVLALLNSRRNTNVFLSNDKTKIISSEYIKQRVLRQLNFIEETILVSIPRGGDHKQEHNGAGTLNQRGIILTVIGLSTQLDVSVALVQQVLTCMEASDIILLVEGSGHYQTDKIVLSRGIVSALQTRIQELLLSATGVDASLPLNSTVFCSALVCALPLYFTLHTVLEPLLPAVVASCISPIFSTGITKNSSAAVTSYSTIYSLSAAQLVLRGIDPAAVVVQSEQSYVQALGRRCAAAYNNFCAASSSSGDDSGNNGKIVSPLDITQAPMQSIREEFAELVTDVPALRSLLSICFPVPDAASVANSDPEGSIAEKGIMSDCRDGSDKLELLLARLILQSNSASGNNANTVSSTDGSSNNSYDDNHLATDVFRGCVLSHRILYHRSFIRARFNAIADLCRETKKSLVVLDTQGQAGLSFLHRWHLYPSFSSFGASSSLLSVEGETKFSTIEYFNHVCSSISLSDGDDGVDNCKSEVPKHLDSITANSGTGKGTVKGILMMVGRFIVRTDRVLRARQMLAAWLGESGDEGEHTQWLSFSHLCSHGVSAGACVDTKDGIMAVFEHILDMSMDMGSQGGRPPPTTDPCSSTLRDVMRKQQCFVSTAKAPGSILCLFKRAFIERVVSDTMRFVCNRHPSLVTSLSPSSSPSGSSAKVASVLEDMVRTAVQEHGLGQDQDKDQGPDKGREEHVPTDALWLVVEPLLFSALRAAQAAYIDQWGEAQGQTFLLGNHATENVKTLSQFACSYQAYTVIGISATSSSTSAVSGSQLSLALELERDERCLQAWNSILGLVCGVVGTGSDPASWMLKSSSPSSRTTIYDMQENPGGKDSSEESLVMHTPVLNQHCISFVLLLTCYTCALQGIHSSALFATTSVCANVSCGADVGTDVHVHGSNVGKNTDTLGHLLTNYFAVCRYRPIPALLSAAAMGVATRWVQLFVTVWDDLVYKNVSASQSVFSVLTTLWMLVLPMEIITAIKIYLQSQSQSQSRETAVVNVVTNASAIQAIRDIFLDAPAAPSLWGFLTYMRRTVVPELGLVLLHQPTTFDTLKKKDRQSFVIEQFVLPTAKRCSVDEIRVCCSIIDRVCASEFTVVSPKCEHDCESASVLFACNILLDLCARLTSLVICRLSQTTGSRRPKFALVSVDIECMECALARTQHQTRNPGSACEQPQGQTATDCVPLTQLRELHRYVRERVLPTRLAVLRGIATSAAANSISVSDNVATILETMRLKTVIYETSNINKNSYSYSNSSGYGGGEARSPIAGVFVLSLLLSLIEYVGIAATAI